VKAKFEIRTVDASNVDEIGFFCYASARKTPGYKQKREWLEARFAEGMKIKILREVGGSDIAFIEYIPGEYAWRAFHAPGYMVIHCLRVMAKGRGKGYGNRLIKECLDDARAQKMYGVATLTSDHTWMPGRDIFERNGFKEMDSAPPAFQLMVTHFESAPVPKPSLPQNWDERAQAFGHGLTVIRTAQCPYLEKGVRDMLAFANEKGVRDMLAFANEKGVQAKSVELKTAQEVQEQSPSAYGISGVVLDGQLLAYQNLPLKDLEKYLLERNKGD
jgi:GNAT superfamily N-acetyltransferase